MAVGIYKPGQGYWVRVLTATFAGVLLAAAAAWLWGQLELASGWIPVRQWEYTLSPVEGDIASGQTVTLLGEPRPGAASTQIGHATVRTLEQMATGARIEIANPQMAAGYDPTQVRQVAAAAGAAGDLRGTVWGTATARPLFQPILLQGGGALLLIAIGAAFIYYYVGHKPGSVEFLIATDGEMKKVNWSTRRDVIGSTWVVIVWSAMIAGGLFIVDMAFSRFFMLVGVLERY
jgi:preprotein translocase SecE subunit